MDWPEATDICWLIRGGDVFECDARRRNCTAVTPRIQRSIQLIGNAREIDCHLVALSADGSVDENILVQVDPIVVEERTGLIDAIRYVADGRPCRAFRSNPHQHDR